MIKKIHPIAGALALLTIATFWLSTALTELFGSQAAVITVKTAIPWGFLLLIPALMAAGSSGFALAKGRPRAGLVGAKVKRMPLIAANGVLILIPSALFLASKARVAEFDSSFYAVQALELSAGDGEHRSARSQHARRPQDEGPVPSPLGWFTARRATHRDPGLVERLTRASPLVHMSDSQEPGYFLSSLNA
jgi:hypothetical protein